MTITFYDEKTNKQYGSFTATRKDGTFSHRQKMQITALRIKLLSTLGENVVSVMIVTDSEFPRHAFYE